MATDQELRDLVLKRVYEFRHVTGWQKLPDALNGLGMDEHTLGNIVGQLRDKGLVRWHRTMGGPCRGAIEITAYGIDEVEDQQRIVIPPIEILEPPMPQAHPTHTQIARYGFWGGLFIAALGVLLFWLGGTGDTSLSAPSILNMKTSNVGLVAFALGVILMVLTFRSVLSSLDKSSK